MNSQLVTPFRSRISQYSRHAISIFFTNPIMRYLQFMSLIFGGFLGLDRALSYLDYKECNVTGHLSSLQPIIYVCYTVSVFSYHIIKEIVKTYLLLLSSPITVPYYVYKNQITITDRTKERYDNESRK